MIEGLFQPMHLLLLGGCFIAALMLVGLLIWLIWYFSKRKAGGPARISGGRDLADRLARLAELKARGLVSEDEYQTKRQQLLDEV